MCIHWAPNTETDCPFLMFLFVLLDEFSFIVLAFFWCYKTHTEWKIIMQSNLLKNLHLQLKRWNDAHSKLFEKWISSQLANTTNEFTILKFFLLCDHYVALCVQLKTVSLSGLNTTEFGRNIFVMPCRTLNIEESVFSFGLLLLSIDDAKYIFHMQCLRHHDVVRCHPNP